MGTAWLLTSNPHVFSQSLRSDLLKKQFLSLWPLLLLYCNVLALTSARVTNEDVPDPVSLPGQPYACCPRPAAAGAAAA